MSTFSSTACRRSRALIVIGLLGAALASIARAQIVSIDTSAGSRGQTIDGFGTCLSSTEGLQSWWQNLYFDDLQCSVLRMDLTPRFKPPYTGMNGTLNSPWYHGNPYFPGPDGNNVRAYTNAADYERPYNGWTAPIAVMGPDINQNTNCLDFSYGTIPVAGALARISAGRSNKLDGFKLIGSLWSPAPWVKVSSGNLCPNLGGTPMPVPGTPWPFIWFDNYAGGKLDTSGTARAEFNDGTGPTSALTQFARGIAAYLRGFQDVYQVRFYAISIQNELNFEEFYNSCTYPLSTGYLAALKAVRAELDKYPDLAPIKIMGPEDLLGGDIWGLWQYGGGDSTTHKNLQHLQNIAADPQASAAEAFFCIHGYASDGVSAANATPTLWDWWANGWTASPTLGIPANVKGFAYYGKKSWMTETSGEDPAWLAPSDGYPNAGAWGLALRLHQALTTGQQSAWLYWQLTDGNPVGASTLTSASLLANSAKYVAVKHFFRFIRPDAVRVKTTISGSTNLLASAYLHDTNQTLTVVMLNTSPDPLSATIAVPAQPPGIASFHTYTSGAANFWQTSTVPVISASATVGVPGYGVVTLYGVAPPLLSARLSGPERLALSWGHAAVGFVLQSASSLTPTPGWANDTNTCVVADAIATVTIAAAGKPRFYRLVLP
jgi:O-glycosyl hydrolase